MKYFSAIALLLLFSCQGREAPHNSPSALDTLGPGSLRIMVTVGWGKSTCLYPALNEDLYNAFSSADVDVEYNLWVQDIVQNNRIVDMDTTLLINNLCHDSSIVMNLKDAKDILGSGLQVSPDTFSAVTKAFWDAGKVVHISQYGYTISGIEELFVDVGNHNE